MANYFVRVKQKVHGPFTLKQLRQLANGAKIRRDSHIREGDSGDWIPAERINGVFDEPQVVVVSDVPQAVRVPMSPLSLKLATQVVLATVICGALLAAIVVRFWGSNEVARREVEAVKTEKEPTIDVVKKEDVPPDDTEPAKAVPDVVEKPKEELLTAKINRWDASVVSIHTEDALGSGFLLEGRGRIVTNYHVIEGAKRATVTFRNGKRIAAIGCVAINQGKDLAILQLAELAPDLPHLDPISAIPPTGEKVYALGSPLGLQGSVSDGLVSGIRTGAEIRDAFKRPTIDVYGDVWKFDMDAVWLQTSAPISGGNSGGPLVNSDGKVVGINSWVRMDGQNINFAISATHVVDLLKDCDGQLITFKELPEPNKSLDELLAKAKEDAAKMKAEKEQVAKLAVEQERKKERGRTLENQNIQQELNRLNDRAITVKSDLRSVEEEGTKLVRTRDNVYSKGQAVEAELISAAGQVSSLESQVIELNYYISNRMLNGVIYLNSHEFEFVQMRQQRDLLVFQGQGLVTRMGTLAATRSALIAELSQLNAQIEIKKAQRAQFLKDVDDLKQQYDKHAADAKKLIN